MTDLWIDDVYFVERTGSRAILCRSYRPIGASRSDRIQGPRS
jgi:hypothetical protein